MKAKSVIVSFLLALLLMSTAYAQDIRAASPGAHLFFSGTTATCYVVIPGAHGDDEINATIELRCGSQSIESWTKNSVGFLEFTDYVSVTKGKTYELVVDYTVNGEAQTSISDSGTCK